MLNAADQRSATGAGELDQQAKDTVPGEKPSKDGSSPGTVENSDQSLMMDEANAEQSVSVCEPGEGEPPSIEELPFTTEDALNPEQIPLEPNLQEDHPAVPQTGPLLLFPPNRDIH